MGWFIGTPLWQWAAALGLSLAGLIALLAEMEVGDCGSCAGYHASGFGKE